MNNILAIDSGANTGWAIFQQGRLQAVGRDSPSLFGLGAKANILTGYQVNEIVIEKPVYRGLESKINPNTLITQALSAGIVLGKTQTIWPNAIQKIVSPSDWKGQLSKQITWIRAEKVLSSDELSLFRTCGSDAKDAVCIGLWHLKRVRYA